MSFWQKMIDKFQNQPNGSGPKLSRKKIWCLVGLVVIGILLVVMGSSGNQQEAKKESASALNNPEASLNLKADSMMSREEKDIATTLQDMLSGIEGAGRVKVTVKLASSSKEEYAINTTTSNKTTEEKDQGGGTRTIQEDTDSNQMVVMRGNAGEEPVVKQEQAAEVAGVLVVAEGAKYPQVKVNPVSYTHLQQLSKDIFGFLCQSKGI